MLIVGLTGSIGMGKSTTSAMFRRAGVAVHDSDLAVHELYASTAVEPISQAFPGVVENGAVNRIALANRVLDNETALHVLQDIVHPLVQAHRNAFVSKAHLAGARVCVLDIPLLFETKTDRAMDVTIVVTAPLHVQKQRVMARHGMTEAKFQAILSKQTPDAQKRLCAHWIVDTSRGLECANRQVLGFLRALLH